MLDLSYQNLIYAKVEDMNDFYRGTLPEIVKIKTLISTLRLIYSLPPDYIELQVSEEGRTYKVLVKGSRKSILGWFYYIPLQKRLDLYSSDTPDVPLIQWKNKRAITKNYSKILDGAGIDKAFDRLLSIL